MVRKRERAQAEMKKERNGASVPYTIRTLMNVTHRLGLRWRHYYYYWDRSSVPDCVFIYCKEQLFLGYGMMSFKCVCVGAYCGVSMFVFLKRRAIFTR